MSNENNDKREAEELKDTFFSEEFFNNIIATLKVKKNIILQGPPGTGKRLFQKK